MKFVTIEIQTMGGGAVGVLATAHDERLHAESAYHSTLAAAALSDLPCHAVVLMTADGTLLDSQHYEHGEGVA